MKFRYARHTSNLQIIKQFYTHILGLEVLGVFEDHEGYEGLFLGKKNENWHLEFTASLTTPKHFPAADDLLVFYPESTQELNLISERITTSKITRFTPQNPYWEKKAIYIKDPDGYGVIIVKKTVEPPVGLSTLRLKVCGLVLLNQVQELQGLNIDFLGFIFYPASPRYALHHLSTEDIAAIDHKGKVGVFVNEALEKVVEMAQKAKLSYLQLHGDENQDFLQNLRIYLPRIKIIKTFRIGANPNIKRIQKLIENFEDDLDYILFDTDTESYGGSGQLFDWGILDQLHIHKPYLLGGGISLENISAIQSLKIKPSALDINSKFEYQPGNKNLDLIKEFIQRYKQLK
ncbi:phosphoribosylanthranilate isomerase [Elizabethkingia argentiflava]|uniref:N-(5'-phosphoribosyl)anthranilate isomerase n=1 Tax=Elizabethkingia argenteiflava TaxID=2681556 RepID=A0A845PQZ8_9FLAO|nr:VOC family protein [Elizabethkingia argenteiflava]NAW50264.1 phosphoribosylanthranilate isomerase [Elizabethkingia argenteiflava]